MGLAERRITSDFQTQHYPALEKKIHEAAGFEVPIEVRWDTLAAGDPKYSKAWIDSWPKIYFAPIIEAFRLIARDEMGKAALKASLKKIVVQDTTTSFASYWAKFDAPSGTLTLDYQFTNVSAIKDRTDVLVKELEKSL
jgi:hypothetical protein